MPELPEVETVKRGLEEKIKGKTIKSFTTSDKKLRMPFPENLSSIKGKKIDNIWRRSKYIMMDLSDGKVLVIHLGMTGTVLYHDIHISKKHDHFTANFDEGLIVFNDPRRFGLVTLVDSEKVNEHKLFKALGPEPLTKEFNGKLLKQIFEGKTQAIKQAIMNGNNLVGVGNIYASEALFRTGIDPTKEAGKISLGKMEELSENIKIVLLEAIKAGGSTLKNFTNSDGDTGYFQRSFKVYDREKEPCISCGASIKRIVQQNRSTFFCPDCQK